ncbi:putative ribonuclease H-like domain-containing protein [Tanacetum coccineum]
MMPSSTVLPQLVTLMSSDGEQGTVSDHSVNDDPIPIPSSEQVTTSTQKELQHNHLIKDCDYYEKKMARKLLLRAQGWFMLMLGKLHQHGLGLTSNKDHPLKHMEHRGIFDSGCSGHMTGNRAHLEDYQELSKVGSVTFGGRSMTIYLLSVLNQANPAQGSKEVIELILMCKMRKLQLYGSINLIMALAKVNTGNTEAISPSADHEEEVFSDADDDEMPEIRIYDKSSEDVPTNPTLRVHNAHPQSQILGDPNTPVQTRSSLKKITEAHALVSEHFKMEAGLKLCVDELLQFKLQHEQKDERGVVQELKLSEVYVSQPPGFVDPDHPTKVYKVVKALYGLHQAPRACIFGVYKSSREQGRHLHISDKYVAEVLKKFDLVSMIGSLMYLTASRPDIMYAVCVCSRFQVTPKTSHLNAVKRIFKYLLQGHNLGLWYPRESPLDLEAFSDSDYGGSNLDRKSTTGGCQFLGQRLISWQCKKQTIVRTSTTEAEYVAAANCCGQVLWVQNQLLDYGFNFMNTKIHIDNESTICIVKNPVYHSKTKHIEIRHHFIRDCYEKKLISVEKIHTDLNVADLLTKPFDGPRFNYLVVSIALYEVQGLRDSGLFFAVPTQSAIASTKEDGFFEISATIDNIRYTITEASIRESLQLDDATGITMLPNDDLFQGMGQIGYPTNGTFTLWKRQEHAAQAQSQPLPPPPPIPSPTPTPIPTSTSPPPIIPSPTPTPIPTSTSPPPIIPSPTPPIPTTTIDQHQPPIPNTTPPHHLRLNLQQMSTSMRSNLLSTITSWCCRCTRSMGVSWGKVNTGSIKLNTVIEQDSTAGEDKGQREGKAPMLSEETPKKSKEQILQEEASLAEAIRLDSLQKEEEAKQIHLDALLAQRIAEEEELTEQQKKRKAQVQFEAQHYTNEDWDLIRAKLEANAELSKSMLGSELQGEDFAKRMVDLVNQRKKFFAEERAKAKRNKPMTQSQLKTYMMNYLKNQGTWKITQLKKLSFEEVKEEFDKLVKQIESFAPISFEATKASLKRFGEELQTKTPKRLKEDKDDESKEDESTKKSGKRRKQMARKGMNTSVDENDSEDSDKVGEHEESNTGTETPINPVPVAMKTPSVATYKIIKQGEKGVYQIVREDGTDIVYINFGAMLKSISRDDLTELYRIVMNRYGMDGPEDKLEKGFWKCLRIMFEEPLSTDSIWSEIGQQKIISWRYYDTCRVHCLNLESMDVYMLSERKYPLSAEVCKTMLKMKLLDGKMSEDCYRLLKMMEKQAGIRK